LLISQQSVNVAVQSKQGLKPSHSTQPIWNVLKTPIEAPGVPEIISKQQPLTS
jgi:hypothetical protein